MGDEHNYKQKFLAAKEMMQSIGPGFFAFGGRGGLNSGVLNVFLSNSQ